jgi:glycerophosphoryl diester phosphodiesterase
VAENTIGSFTRALQLGATGLEFDVRRCGDGRLIVIHDETIDRTTNGKGRVARLSYEELRQFDAGSGEVIPLLSDVLDGFAARCILNIELKDTEIARDVAKLVIERNLRQNVIVSAFDWNELEPLSGAVPIALLSSKPANLIPAARDLSATAIHPRQDLVTTSLLTAAREAGLKVHVWTVNEPSEILYFRNLLVDGIFTDFPERA